MRMNIRALCFLALFSMVFHAGSAQVLTSSNLPLVVINTHGVEILDDPKIEADMGIIYNGEGVRNNLTDPFNHYNGKIGIELRGQSSQMFPMKPYGFELRDNAGNSQNKPLFGFPSESDWILYAPYNDKTLMHNFLAYTMSREMGRYASRCRYVELVLNGEYRGIYILMEKIKRNSGRVNVTKLNAADISGDAVTGGYIFSIDKEADGWYSEYFPQESTMGQRIRYSYVVPKITAVVPEQIEYIRNYTDSFERTLFNEGFQHKTKGWRRYADESSFIDYFLVNEISHNVDGYRLSAYFSKDRYSKGGKINAGPVWDYDLGFRNANYCRGADTVGWAWQFNETCPQDFWQVPFWWDRFDKDTAFMAHLRCRWKQLRAGSLSDNRINTLIDSIASLTAEARQRHFQKWPVLGTYVWPNVDPIPATYADEISVLKEWLGKRLTWIGNNIPNRGACYDFPPGIKETVLISVAPNPVYDLFTIDVKSKQDQDLLLSVYDAGGRQVWAKQFSLQEGNIQVPVSSAVWQRGVYFLSYRSTGGTVGSRRILKL